MRAYCRKLSGPKQPLASRPEHALATQTWLGKRDFEAHLIYFRRYVAREGGFLEKLLFGGKTLGYAHCEGPVSLLGCGMLRGTPQFIWGRTKYVDLNQVLSS